MPRVISYGRQRAKLGIVGRTNAGAVRRYRRAKLSYRAYSRVKGRRVTGNRRFRLAVRRLLPSIRRMKLGMQKRGAVSQFQRAATMAFFSPPRTRSGAYQSPYGGRGKY